MTKKASTIVVTFDSVVVSKEQDKYSSAPTVLSSGQVSLEDKRLYLDEARRQFKVRDVLSVDVDRNGQRLTLRVARHESTHIIACQGPSQDKDFVSLVKRLSVFAQKFQTDESSSVPSSLTKKKMAKTVAPLRKDTTAWNPTTTTTTTTTTTSSSTQRRKTFARRGQRHRISATPSSFQQPWTPSPKEFLDLPSADEDDDQEEEIQPQNGRPRSRPRRRAIMEEDEDSDNDVGNEKENKFDEEEEEQVDMTTPMASTQRVVSPSRTASLLAKKKSEQLADQSEEDPEDPTEGMGTEPPLVKTTKMNTLDHFFLPNNNKNNKGSVVDTHQKKRKASSQTPPRSFDPQTNYKRKQEFALTPTRKTPKRLLTSPKSAKTKALTNDGGQWLSQTRAAVQSPLKQQSQKLFGANHTNLFSNKDSYKTLDDGSLDVPTSSSSDYDEITKTPPHTKQPIDALLSKSTLPRLGNPKTNGSRLKNRYLNPRLNLDKEISTLTPRRTSLGTSFALSRSPASPPQVVTRRYRGLRNLGNTCYMNSVLQMLAPWARDSLKVGPLGQATVAPLWHRISQKLLTDTTTDDLSQALDPSALKEAIDQKTDKFQGFEQRDAHEFLNDLIDHTHDELEQNQTKLKEQKEMGASNCKLATNDFELTVAVTLKCTHCQYRRVKTEMYRHLSLALPLLRDQEEGVTASLPSSLDQFFQPEERELRCEKCNEGTHATQTMKIVQQPKWLLLHLKRFVVVEKPRVPAGGRDENDHPNSPSTGQMVDYEFLKNKVKVELLPELTLVPYLSPSSDEAPKADEANVKHQSEYKLESVVYHIGRSADSGHYTADCLRPSLNGSEEEEKEQEQERDEVQQAKKEEGSCDKEEMIAKRQWTRFDDENSAKRSFEHSRKSPFNQRTAYMLLYKLK